MVINCLSCSLQYGLNNYWSHLFPNKRAVPIACNLIRGWNRTWNTNTNGCLLRESLKIRVVAHCREDKKSIKSGTCTFTYCLFTIWDENILWCICLQQQFSFYVSNLLIFHSRVKYVLRCFTWKNWILKRFY